MANIKFSQFTSQTDYNNVADLVGYDGLVNVRITPDDLISSYLSTHPRSAFVDGIIIGDGGSSVSVNVQIGSVAKSISQINLSHGAGISDGGFIRASSNLNLGIGSTDKLKIESSLVTVDEDFLVDSSTAAFTGQVGIGTTTPNFNLDVIGDSNFGGAVGFSSAATFNNDIIDFNGATGNSGFILKSNGGGGNGVSWRQEQPGCQIKIVGGAGLTNTNNGTDFLVPYNTVIVNDDATIFNPVVTGGFGNQGAIQVLQSGRYEFFARYASFDLIQSSLPTVDGTKFFRITAATDVAAPGIGTKQCILQDLIVATSTNGEANVTGGGFMDLNAGDYFKIIGFHTGATGGSGTQGFPVSSNAFFNEPMLWLVKIQ